MKEYGYVEDEDESPYADKPGLVDSDSSEEEETQAQDVFPLTIPKKNIGRSKIQTRNEKIRWEERADRKGR